MTEKHRADLAKSNFNYFHMITTRWADNDIYGHINNVTYYSFFDTAVNCYLIEHCGLDIHEGIIVAYVAGSKCDYFSPVAYPQEVDVGLRVKRLGNSSVTYQLAVFPHTMETAVAVGEFVHVFVDKRTSRSVTIPEGIREKLTKLFTDDA